MTEFDTYQGASTISLKTLDWKRSKISMSELDVVRMRNHIYINTQLNEHIYSLISTFRESQIFLNLSTGITYNFSFLFSIVRQLSSWLYLIYFQSYSLSSIIFPSLPQNASSFSLPSLPNPSLPPSYSPLSALYVSISLSLFSHMENASEILLSSRVQQTRLCSNIFNETAVGVPSSWQT
jgi:hypothetical protein